MYNAHVMFAKLIISGVMGYGLAFAAVKYDPILWGLFGLYLLRISLDNN